MQLLVNGEVRTVDVEDDMPLLWVLRDELGLKVTKYGCGIAQCGACTVHVNGTAQRSCVMPLAAVQGQQVTTIEGLAPSEDELHPLQQAWIDEQVPQCGYCQSGQIMNAVGLLRENAKPTGDEVDEYMYGNACRCATYQRIRNGVLRAAEILEA